MRKFLVIAALFAAVAVRAAEPAASHRAAAVDFLVAKGTPQLLERQCLLMVEKQIALQPKLAEHRDNCWHSTAAPSASMRSRTIWRRSMPGNIPRRSCGS